MTNVTPICQIMTVPIRHMTIRITHNSVENKKPKSVRTKLVQHQSFAQGVPDKHKKLAQVQDIGNAVSKPTPRENAPAEGSADKVEKLSKVEIPTTHTSKENAAVCGDKVRRKKVLQESTKNYQKHYQQKTTAECVENHPPSEAKIPDLVRQVPKKNIQAEVCEDTCALEESVPFPVVRTFVKKTTHQQRKNQQRLGPLLRAKRSGTVKWKKMVQRVLTINNHQMGTFHQRGLKIGKLQREMYRHRKNKLQWTKDRRRASKIIKQQRKTHMQTEMKIAWFQRKIDQQRELRICKFLKRMHQHRQLNMSKFQERLYQQRVLKCSKFQRIIYLRKGLKISNFQRKVHKEMLKISKFLKRIYRQQMAKAKFQRRNFKRKERKARRLQHKNIVASTNHSNMASSSMSNSTTSRDHTASISMKSSISTMWGNSSHDHRASSSMNSSTSNHYENAFSTMWGTSCFVDDTVSNSVWAPQWGTTSNHSNRAFSSVQYSTHSSSTWSSVHTAATKITSTSTTPALSFSPGVQVKSKAGISSTPQKVGGLHYCPHCSRTERYLNTLYTHIRKEHTRSLECGVCGKEYNLAQGLKQHMKNKH